MGRGGSGGRHACAGDGRDDARRDLGLARAAGERGGLAPCVFNAANEEAVTAFTSGQCRFDEVVSLVGAALGAFDDGDASTVEHVLDADAWARGFVRANTAGAVPAR